jgi:D-alanyl-D-alanine carboxypeptidase
VRGWATKLAGVLAAAAVAGAGIAGAYSYGEAYNVHRGFAALVPFRRAGSGRLEQVRFYSPALHRVADYLVYLPPHYSQRRRYPVYYLLHGSPGQPRVFVDIANMDIRLDNQLSLGRVRPMILVYPDGRIGGSTFSDSEWANTPSGNYESYVIDVVHNVDRHFSTIARRQDRVIAGFSAGAYGAMNIALHQLPTFADVQSWSGYFKQTRTGVFANAGPAALADNSPIDYVSGLRRVLRAYPLRVYMFVGRLDDSSAQQVPMARALAAAGARVQYRFYPGGHDWSVWYPRLNEMLDLASRDVARPPRPVLAASPRPARLSSRPRATLSPVPPRATLSHVPPRATLSPVPPRATLSPVHTGPHHRRRRSELGLIGALLLALLSATLINLGFVLQHRGHDRARAAGRGGLAGGFREPTWLIGQTTGWIGFAGQIVAVALAPLTIVQAFSAGSLALSVPLAARALGHRVGRRQLAAIALIAVSLASLTVSSGHGHGALQPGLLIAPALLVMLVGGLLFTRAAPVVLAVAAGAFYGVADGAIKAASIGIRFHATGIFTGWTMLAALCTFGGFLTFQAALRDGDAVGAVSLMNACTALAAIGLGIAAFGEPLGTGPVSTLLHGVAIVVVLACVRPLAEAQQRFVGEGAQAGATPARRERIASAPPPSVRIAARRVSGILLGGATLVAGSVIALGLLYELRQLGWFGAGPRASDALPLLQLAGFDAQPVTRLALASLLSGLVVGLALHRVDRRHRAVLVGVFTLGLMLAGSDASYALARNLRFDHTLVGHAPGLGPWIEAVLLTAGSAVAGPLRRIRRGAFVSHLPAWARIRLAGRWGTAPALAAPLVVLALVALVTAGNHARAQTSARHPGRHGSRRAALASSDLVRAVSPAAARRSPLDAALDAALATHRARLHAPAATAAVVACGRVMWAGATGVTDVDTRRRATAGSLFILNSAAKTLVATMIMQEVQAGRLSLSTPLSDFYPRLINARRISVRMLLNMTSGLPDYLDNPRIQWTISHQPRHRWTVAQVLSGLGTGLGAPEFAPGQGYGYSDTNYIILGAILQRITHRSVERNLQRLIAQPLGLTAMTFVPTPGDEARIAHPYVLTGTGTPSSRWIPGYGVSSAVWGPVFTDGGLASSSPDLALFANALLGGRLLDGPALGQMTHIGRGNYGFGIRGRAFDGHRWLGHAGYFGGYQAEGWTDRERRLTIAVATNFERPGAGLSVDEIWRAIVRTYDSRSPANSGCPAPPGDGAPVSAPADIPQQPSRPGGGSTSGAASSRARS